MLTDNILDSETFKLSASKSRKILTTNLTFHLFVDPTRLQDFGKPPDDLGRWISNRNVYTLQNSKNGRIQDNLCVFRAVVCFLKLIANPSFKPQNCSIRDVHTLYHEYRQEKDSNLPHHPI